MNYGAFRQVAQHLGTVGGDARALADLGFVHGATYVAGHPLDATAFAGWAIKNAVMDICQARTKDGRGNAPVYDRLCRALRAPVPKA